MDKKTKVIAIAFADLAIGRILEAVRKQVPNAEIILHDDSGSEIELTRFVTREIMRNFSIVEEVFEEEFKSDSSSTSKKED